MITSGDYGEVLNRLHPRTLIFLSGLLPVKLESCLVQNFRSFFFFNMFIAPWGLNTVKLQSSSERRKNGFLPSMCIGDVILIDCLLFVLN